MLEEIVVVLGSCSVDFTTYAPRLPGPGETLHGTKFTTSYGGKGANQCVAAARLGANVHMVARVGTDEWGERYLHNLQDQGVHTTHVHVSQGYCTGIAQICVGDDGENQIVIVNGANAAVCEADVQQAAELVRRAAVLVAQLETPIPATRTAFELNTNIRILNAAPASKDALDLLPLTTILCVNESEAAQLTGLHVQDVRWGIIGFMSAIVAIHKLLEHGCNTVIVTLGSEGAVFKEKNGSTTHVPTQRVTAVDTTGAGDAFVGALAALLSRSAEPLHQLVGAACEVASLSVTRQGTQTSYPVDFVPFDRQYPFTILEDRE